MTTLKLRPEPQKEVPSEDQATANLGYLYIYIYLFPTSINKSQALQLAVYPEPRLVPGTKLGTGPE